MNSPDSSSSALIAHLAEDFDALQQAALADAFGTATPHTSAALASPELFRARVGALLHAETLARGELHRARLASVPDRQWRALSRRLQRIAQARSRAARQAKKQQAALPSPFRPPLAQRVLAKARPAAYRAAYEAVCAESGLDAAQLCVPTDPVWEWARDRGLLSSAQPAGAQQLLTCSEEEFVQALLSDARVAENRYLTHDAVAERWAAHAREAQAWGRYAIALAEQAVLVRPVNARAAELDALDDAYQDAAILALRAHEAAGCRAALHQRVRRLAEPLIGPLRLACGSQAAQRLAAADPGLWQEISAACELHQQTCRHSGDDCPGCPCLLAPAFLAGDGVDDEEPSLMPAAPSALDPARYALLTDVPADVPWTVADAAINAEESARCGYGWAAADGSTGWGDSLASASGEAEVIAVCQALLALLERNPQRRVLVLCDSVQAVEAVRAALDGEDSFAVRRTVLFPQARALLDEVAVHGDRIEVRWLKGHIGHDLNETADALARLALRRASGRMPAPAADKAATEISRSFQASNLTHPQAA